MGPDDRTQLIAAAQPGYLSAYNIVATIGLAVLVAGAVPLVARYKHLSGLPAWLGRLPTPLLIGVTTLGLAALVVAYGVLY